MRRETAVTPRRRSRLGVGALMLAVPCGAAALAAGQALAAPNQGSLHITSRAIRIPYGDQVILRGTALASDAGHTIVLQFARRGESAWRQLSSSTIDRVGRFRLAAALAQSGSLRALDASSGSLTPFVARGSTGGAGQASGPMPVDVAAQVHVPDRQISLLGGQAAEVRGRLLPGRAGRRVSLQGREAGGWQTLDTARTGSAGQFLLRYVASNPGQEPIRVRFAGDRLNGRVDARAGRLTVYRGAGASWYNDGGTTACGFHAYYGVANRTLPCGTTVSFRYNGRSVTATVDDRGPFVAGRDWDLNQNTAGALGFGGVDTVWSSQ